jgi:hypothetical protein
MSDPTDVLMPELRLWLKADTEVIAAFQDKPLKVFDDTPIANEPYPYVYLSGVTVEDARGDCYDAAEPDLQIDVWSRSRPEARRIAKAVKASLLRCADTGDSPAFTISGHRVVAVEPISTQYLTDPSDGKTVHAVIAARLSVDPL